MTIFEQVKDRFNEKYRLGSTPWSHERGYTYVRKYISLLKKQNPKPRVLDLGCGDGWVAIYCAQKGVEVVGIDSSAIAIAKAKRTARQLGVRNAKFVVGDALKVSYRKQFFDGIIDRGMLHHQPSSVWSNYRKQLQRILKPGGLLFLVVFDANNKKPRAYKAVKKQLGYKYKDKLTGLYSYDRYFTDAEVKKALGNTFHILIRNEQHSNNIKTGLLNYVLKYLPG